MLRIISEGHGIDLLLCQEAVLRQKIQVYEVRVACISRRTLIWRIAVAGRTYWQYLPPGLPRIMEKIHEVVRRFSDSADPVRRRQ